MKTINNLTHFTRLYTLLFTFLVIGMANAALAQEASIKVVFNNTSANLTEAEVMIKSNSVDPFLLGEHNIRMYYNAETLVFAPEAVESKLPIAYDTPELLESIAFDVNDFSETSYNNVGFLNISIGLANLEYDALTVDDSWHSIMVFSFESRGVINEKDIVIASLTSTSHFATAFTELTEWISPSETRALKVVVAANELRENTVFAKSDIDIKVGPNPTSDLVYVTSAESIKTLSLISMDGKRLIINIVNGERASLNISDVQSGKYILEIISASGHIWNKQIIKI